MLDCNNSTETINIVDENGEKLEISDNISNIREGTSSKGDSFLVFDINSDDVKYTMSTAISSTIDKGHPVRGAILDNYFKIKGVEEKLVRPINVFDNKVNLIESNVIFNDKNYADITGAGLIHDKNSDKNVKAFFSMHADVPVFYAYDIENNIHATGVASINGLIGQNPKVEGQDVSYGDSIAKNLVDEIVKNGAEKDNIKLAVFPGNKDYKFYGDFYENYVNHKYVDYVTQSIANNIVREDSKSTGSVNINLLGVLFSQLEHVGITEDNIDKSFAFNNETTKVICHDSGEQQEYSFDSKRRCDNSSGKEIWNGLNIVQMNFYNPQSESLAVGSSSIGRKF